MKWEPRCRMAQGPSVRVFSFCRAARFGFALWALVATAGAQGWNVELVGQIGGECSAVHVQGNYAYLGEGWHLKILDVSNSTSPVVVGRCPLSDEVTDVFTTGGLAYVTARQTGFDILDVRDPTAPRLVGSYSSMEECLSGIHVSGGLAYVIDYHSTGREWWHILQIVDVSNPSTPTRRSSYGTSVYDVYGVGTRAYLAAGHLGLQILDVSDPASPTLVGSVATPAFAEAIHVADNMAYVSYGRYMSEGTLQVIDVSDPTSPSVRGVYDLPGYVSGVSTADGLVYVLQHTEVLIYELSHPSSATLRGRCPEIWPRDISLRDGLAYVACGSVGVGLRVFDVANPSTPTLRSFCRTPGSCLDVATSGGLAYVAGWWGTYVVDITDPAWPVVRGTHPCGGDHMYVAGGLAYVCPGRGGFSILDVNNPTSPVLLGSYGTPHYPQAIFVAGHRAYIALNHEESFGYPKPGSLWIFNVSDPTSPTLLGSYDIPDSPYNVHVSDGLAFVTASGLYILDVSDPTSPTLRSSCDLPGAYSVSVAGNLAYVGSVGGNGLKIFDVSDPTSPVLLGTCPSVGGDVYVSGNLAYLSGVGLEVVDVSNPAAPTLRATFDLPGYPIAVCAAAGLAYVAADQSGLWILRCAPLPARARPAWRQYR